MGTEADVRDLVTAAIEEVNLTAPPEQQCPTDDEAVLFGAGGCLDSLGLVNLIVALEQELADRLDVTIALADERVMSQKQSPFRTVASLRSYVHERIGETVGG